MCQAVFLVLWLLHGDSLPTWSSHSDEEAKRFHALKKNLAGLRVLNAGVGAEMLGRIDREGLSHL